MVPQSTDSKQDWITPAWVLRGLAPLQLSLDVAADARNKQLPRYYTEQQDALVQPWAEPFWCNPPYRRAGKFVEHSIPQVREHSIWGVHLLRIPSIGCGWWMRTAPFCLTVPVAPRIHFIDHQNPDKDTAPHGSMLMFVTPKTVAQALRGVTPFTPANAKNPEDLLRWLSAHWMEIF